MNNPARFIFSVCMWVVVLLFSPLSLTAQNISQLNTLSNIPIEVSFFSAQPPSTLQSPSHGQISSTFTAANSSYNYRYTPDRGFAGQDTFKLEVVATGLEYWFHVTVTANNVVAKDDYALTTEGQAVNIAVLDNDSATVGSLHIKAIPLANHGTVDTLGGVIRFAPNTGFKGVTHLNYTVCNDGETKCVTGLATIHVAAQTIPATDTTKIFVLKNQSVNFTLPEGFNRNSVAARGNFYRFGSDNTAYHQYRPFTNAVGRDSAVFYQLQNGRALQHFVRISILDRPATPQYAVNDAVFIGLNQTQAILPLRNDADSVSLLSVGSCPDGTIQRSGDTLWFTPTLDFEGFTAFNYTISYPNGTEETATVKVSVNNFLPATENITLYTTLGTPLAIDYHSPLSNLQVTCTAPASGTAYYNALEQKIIYAPTGTAPNDQFDATFCVANNCRTVHLNVIRTANNNNNPNGACLSDCVWAGDANNDGVVNTSDLMRVGQYIGESGAARLNNQERFVGQSANNWFNTRSNGIDLKHADTNGDGFISAADTAAIRRNYGLRHGIPAEGMVFPSDIILNFQSDNTQVQSGDILVLHVLMGNENTPAFDAAGYAFDFNFDANRIAPENLTVDFVSSNWLYPPCAK
jgi:hypothetical protein